MLLYIISYDIPCPQRCQKVAELLERYGKRVQFSVFECVLSEEKYDELRKHLQKQVNLAEDNLRFYPVSRLTLEYVETWRVRPPLRDKSRLFFSHKIVASPAPGASNVNLPLRNQSHLLYAQRIQRIAEFAFQADSSATNPSAEIEHLRELVGDRLATAHGNKWYLRVGCVPSSPDESCTMWDDISQWGDEALRIWEEQLSRYIGKLKKPCCWRGGERIFTREHLDAMIAAVGNYDVWVARSNSNQPYDKK